MGLKGAGNDSLDPDAAKDEYPESSLGDNAYDSEALRERLLPVEEARCSVGRDGGVYRSMVGEEYFLGSPTGGGGRPKFFIGGIFAERGAWGMGGQEYFLSLSLFWSFS